MVCALRTSRDRERMDRGRQIRTDVVDRGDIVANGAEAKSTMTDQFHLIVETLQGSVRDPQCGPGENSFHMRADKLSKFLHGFQTTVRRLPEPVEKKAFGVEPAFVMPEELKGFLQ